VTLSVPRGHRWFSHMTPWMLALAVIPLSLGGCGLQIETAQEISQGVDTTALALYGGLASGVTSFDALPSTTPAQATAANAIVAKAWADLEVVNSAYDIGTALTGAWLTPLQADANSVTSLTGQPVTPATGATRKSVQPPKVSL